MICQASRSVYVRILVLPCLAAVGDSSAAGEVFVAVVGERCVLYIGDPTIVLNPPHPVLIPAALRRRVRVFWT